MTAVSSLRAITESHFPDTGTMADKLRFFVSYAILAAAYLNQPIEVMDLRQRLGDLIGISGFPQLLLRMGYGPEVEPTHRRGVDEVVR